jgi:hypothetical protein
MVRSRNQRKADSIVREAISGQNSKVMVFRKDHRCVGTVRESAVGATSL